MKLPLLISAGLVALAAVLPVVRHFPAEEAHASSKPGKAAMRERGTPVPREADSPELDPRRAVTELLAAAGDQTPGVDFYEALALWADRAPLEVLEWLLTTGRGDLARAYTSAIAALAWESPEVAARWLEIHPDHGGFDNWAAVLAPWGEIAPAAAHQWVREHLAVDLQEALRPVMLATFREPAVTAAILEEGITDEILVELARGSMNRDPGFAGVLIGRVKSEELREAARERLARHHGGTDLGDLVQDAGAGNQED